MHKNPPEGYIEVDKKTIGIYLDAMMCFKEKIFTLLHIGEKVYFLPDLDKQQYENGTNKRIYIIAGDTFVEWRYVN